MVVPRVFVFVQRVEVSVTALLPLHTGFQKEVFSDEIQILIAGFEPGICEEIKKKKKICWTMGLFWHRA